ncbi:MAG: RAD55 family ATPase [Candidatus Micrarchaeia archaeon]
MIEKIKTGIEGLDELLNGGIPKGNQIFVVGGPGTGKTLLCNEFLYHGAENGENGVFFALEEPSSSVIKNVVETFSSLSFKELIESKKIVYVDISLEKEEYGIGKLAQKIESEIKENDAKRVVVDSATLIKHLSTDILSYRKNMVSVLQKLKSLNVTSIFTGELNTLKREIIFEPEHYICDGLISLYNILSDSKRFLGLEILKMRGTKHSKMFVPFEITSEGIKVKGYER